MVKLSEFMSTGETVTILAIVALMLGVFAYGMVSAVIQVYAWAVSLFF